MAPASSALHVPVWVRRGVSCLPAVSSKGAQFRKRRHEFSPAHFATQEQYAGTGLPPLPDITALVSGVRAGRHRLLSWDVEPGDAIVFDAMIVHGQMTPSSTRHAETEASRAAQADDEADSTPWTSDGLVYFQFRRLATRWTGGKSASGGHSN